MTDLVIGEQNAARLREIAEREQRPVEEVISRMIEVYNTAADDKHEIDEVEREVLTKIYAEARAYWRQVGDGERLKLTDEQLDEQFWIIDPDGIPRLKSEQDKIQLPENGLLRMARLAEERGPNPAARTDISEHFDEVMEETFRKEWEERKRSQHGE